MTITADNRLLMLEMFVSFCNFKINENELDACARLVKGVVGTKLEKIANVYPPLSRYDDDELWSWWLGRTVLCYRSPSPCLFTTFVISIMGTSSCDSEQAYLPYFCVIGHIITTNLKQR